MSRFSISWTWRISAPVLAARPGRASATRSWSTISPTICPSRPMSSAIVAACTPFSARRSRSAAIHSSTTNPSSLRGPDHADESDVPPVQMYPRDRDDRTGFDDSDHVGVSRWRLRSGQPRLHHLPSEQCRDDDGQHRLANAQQQQLLRLEYHRPSPIYQCRVAAAQFDRTDYSARNRPGGGDRDDRDPGGGDHEDAQPGSDDLLAV